MRYQESSTLDSTDSYDITLQANPIHRDIEVNPSDIGRNSYEESIVNLFGLVTTEVSSQSITNTIFSKVVLNEPSNTLDRIFQCRGVGYEYFVQMIRTFLTTVPYEERAKRYKNVSRLITESREDTVDRLSRDMILDVIQQTKAEMSRMGLTQQVFAKVVLGRTAGIVSQMFKFNGVGYEKHINTIRNFLGRPAEERHMLYKKGQAPAPWDNQAVRLSSSSSLQRVTVPEGLASEFLVAETPATVNQITNSAFSSLKQQKSEAESAAVMN